MHTLRVYTRPAELINKNNANQLPKHAPHHRLAKQDGLATHGDALYLYRMYMQHTTTLILTTLRVNTDLISRTLTCNPLVY